MNGKHVFGSETNKIKYKIFTDSLFNIHLVLLLHSVISISEVQKQFFVLDSQIVV